MLGHHRLTEDLRQELTATWIALFELITEQQAFWANNGDELKPLQVAVERLHPFRLLLQSVACNRD